MCLPRLSPIGEDVPDDAVVPLADDEFHRPRSREALPGPASRDEAPQLQDLLVRQSEMGLPAAGRAHARDEISDRTAVNVIAIMLEPSAKASQGS